MLVDLAGSERTNIYEGVNHRMQKETIQINKSLMTLRKVIQNLVKSEKQQRTPNLHHIPFRESKLTALLKHTLSGNSYCLMIACLSPSDANLFENL